MTREFKIKTNYSNLLCLCFLTFFLTQSQALPLSKVGILATGVQAGHYLQWNGNPILLIGDSVTQGWIESGTNFDQAAYVDALAGRGINLLMIWSFIATSAANQQDDDRIGYDAPEIWPWAGSPDHANFDLTQLNQAYFDNLKNLISYAESRGIVVLITVHDGWPKGRFDFHPFNSTLGNGPLTSKTQYVELYDYSREMPPTYDSSWNRKQKNQYFQERFCDKLINELNQYSNVIYELFNEGEWYDNNDRNQHEQHFLAFFRARCSNLLLSNTDHISGDDPHNDSKVDIITLHKDWTGRFGDYQSGFNTFPAKPYLKSEPVPGWIGTNVSMDDIRKSMWETAIGGAGWVNQNDCSFGWDSNAAITSQAAKRDEAYDYAGHCARFFNEMDVDFSNMKPRGDLSSTGICMAREGTEYVIYSNSGGSFSVNLSAVGDSMHSEWYNPRTGEIINGTSIRGGSTQSFNKPSSSDWVLHLSTNKVMNIKSNYGKILLRESELSQNYPNPFNPITNIKFSLKESTHVSLSVYDTLGREVNIIYQNEWLPSGEYEVSFNGSQLESGIYFYHFDTNFASESRKMVLIK